MLAAGRSQPATAPRRTPSNKGGQPDAPLAGDTCAVNVTYSDTLAGALTLTGVAVAGGSLGVLHALPSGLSPLRNPVSQYGIGRYRLGYRIAALGLGLAGVAAAIGLNAVLGGDPTGVITLLVVFALARALISWVPMDEPGTARTATGHAHGVLAILAFASATIAALRLGTALRETRVVISSLPLETVLRDARVWDAIATISTAIGWYMVTISALMVLT